MISISIPFSQNEMLTMLLTEIMYFHDFQRPRSQVGLTGHVVFFSSSTFKNEDGCFLLT
jgi:hypothetical protein